MTNGEHAEKSDVCCSTTGLLTEVGVKKAISKDELDIWLLVSGVRGTPKKRKFRDSEFSGDDIRIKDYLCSKYRESIPVHDGAEDSESSYESCKSCDRRNTHKRSELARNFIQNNITGSSVDFSFDSFQQVYCVDRREFLPKRGKWKRPEDSGYYVEIPPKSTVTVWTREWLRTGECIAAVIQAKVNNVLYGFSHVSTKINPNWDGELLITFTNMLDKPLRLEHGAPIASIVFFRVPYASKRNPAVTSERNRWWMRSYAADAEQKCRENRIFRWAWCGGVLLFFIIGFSVVSFFELEEKYAFLDPAKVLDVWNNPWFVAIALLSVHLGLKPFMPPLDEKVRIILSSILGCKF